MRRATIGNKRGFDFFKVWENKTAINIQRIRSGARGGSFRGCDQQQPLEEVLDFPKVLTNRISYKRKSGGSRLIEVIVYFECTLHRLVLLLSSTLTSLVIPKSLSLLRCCSLQCSERFVSVDFMFRE